MQRGDLIVEGLAALVETAQSAGDHFTDHGLGDALDAVVFFGKVGGDLQQIECAACIAVGGLGEQIA